MSHPIVDAHVHLVRPFDSHGRPQIYTPGPGASAQDYISLMERWGIEKAFYISWSPEDIPSDLSGKGLDPERVRGTLNIAYAREVMSNFADRFHWFPCHVSPTNRHYLAQARSNMEAGAAGIKLVPSFWGELPDDRRLLPLYDLADEYGAKIILDTSFWYLGKDQPTDPDALPPGHRQVARRVTDFSDYLSHLRTVLGSHPDVNFSLAHAGARTFTPEHARESGGFIAEHDNLFADLGALAAPSNARAITTLVEAAGDDRVMFGTDWPHFAQGPAMGMALDSVRENAGLSPGARRMILGGNALRFLGKR